MRLITFLKGRVCSALALVVLAGLSTVSHAAFLTFNITATGLEEVTSGGAPNQGDLDGSAMGTLLLDSGTGFGSTGSATFSLTLSNIDLNTLSAHHVHQGLATTTGSPVLDFGDPDTIRSGSALSGTITGLSATTITNILANPSGLDRKSTRLNSSH